MIANSKGNGVHPLEKEIVNVITVVNGIRCPLDYQLPIPLRKPITELLKLLYGWMSSFQP